MQRVLIIGSPGAGKSTFARELAQKTALPLVHLDQIYWRPNWIEPVKSEFKTKLAYVLKQPEWIIDGNYGSTLAERLQHADAVIYFDFPTRVCLFRAFKRTLQSRGEVRVDMAPECPERFDAKFFLYIAMFRRNKRGGLLAAIEKFPGTKWVARAPDEVQALLEMLGEP